MLGPDNEFLIIQTVFNGPLRFALKGSCCVPLSDDWHCSVILCIFPPNMLEIGCKTGKLHSWRKFSNWWCIQLNTLPRFDRRQSWQEINSSFMVSITQLQNKNKDTHYKNLGDFWFETFVVCDPIFVSQSRVLLTTRYRQLACLLSLRVLTAPCTSLHGYKSCFHSEVHCHSWAHLLAVYHKDQGLLLKQVNTEHATTIGLWFLTLQS